MLSELQGLLSGPHQVTFVVTGPVVTVRDAGMVWTCLRCSSVPEP